jgi:hypothetical protein
MCEKHVKVRTASNSDHFAANHVDDSARGFESNSKSGKVQLRIVPSRDSVSVVKNGIDEAANLILAVQRKFGIHPLSQDIKKTEIVPHRGLDNRNFSTALGDNAQHSNMPAAIEMQNSLQGGIMMIFHDSVDH